MLKEKKQRDRQTLRWIFSISSGYRLKIIFFCILGSLGSLCAVVTAWSVKGIINGANMRDANLLFSNAVMLCVLILLQAILKLISGNSLERVKAKLENSLRINIFRNLLNKNYTELSAYHSGEVLNRLSSDTVVVSNSISTLLPGIISLVTRLGAAVFMMILLEPWFALAFSLAGIVIFLLTRLFRPYLKRMHKLAQETQGRRNSYLQESIVNVLVIKVFSAYDRVVERGKKLQGDEYRVRIKRATVSIFSSTAMSLIFSGGYVFAMIWGAYRVYNGQMDIGTVTAILQLVNQIQSPFASLSGFVSTYYSLLASAERLIEFEDLSDEDKNLSAPVERDFYEKLEKISVRNLSFSYDDELVLDNVSLDIKKGEFVAISGISGIGKSTLMKLMLALLYPQSGGIDFVSCDYPVRAADCKTRALFSYVPQGNMLLSGTIEQNITFFSSQADTNALEQAVDLSCSREFIDDLPDGLQTKIGERGTGLSEGQVQRLAIARAIYSGALVLLLDEATSALDEQTQAQLMENLREIKDLTCIVVSHKPSTISACDREIKLGE